MSKGFEGLPALPEPEWHDNPPMYGQRQMWAYAIEHARHLAESRAKLLEALQALFQRCVSELVDPEDVWEMGAAQTAIANATQQRNAAGGEG